VAAQAEHNEEARRSSHTHPAFMGKLSTEWEGQFRGSRSPQNEQVRLRESPFVVESRGVISGGCARLNLPYSCFAR